MKSRHIIFSRISLSKIDSNEVTYNLVDRKEVCGAPPKWKKKLLWVEGNGNKIQGQKKKGGCWLLQKYFPLGDGRSLSGRLLN